MQGAVVLHMWMLSQQQLHLEMLEMQIWGPQSSPPESDSGGGSQQSALTWPPRDSGACRHQKREDPVVVLDHRTVSRNRLGLLLQAGGRAAGH